MKTDIGGIQMNADHRIHQEIDLEEVRQEIRRVIAVLIHKYHNRDPFYIARNIGIGYTFLDFDGELSAFSERRNAKDKGQIYINKKYGAYARKILCAHELGHLCLHGENGDTFFDSDIEPEKEYEANYFAAILMPQIIINKDILKFSIKTFNDYMVYKVNDAERFEIFKL